MKLIFDQFYLTIKLNVLMMSFVDTPTSGPSSEENYVIRKIAKPGAVPQPARVSALTTAKDSNSSTCISRGVQKFVSLRKI